MGFKFNVRQIVENHRKPPGFHADFPGHPQPGWVGIVLSRYFDGCYHESRHPVYNVFFREDSSTWLCEECELRRYVEPWPGGERADTPDLESGA